MTDEIKVGDFVAVKVGSSGLRCPVLKVIGATKDHITLLWPEGIETIPQLRGSWGRANSEVTVLVECCDCFFCKSPLIALAHLI